MPVATWHSAFAPPAAHCWCRTRLFGLTQIVYVVFTATVLSLLGLRQLCFLLDGLLDRLVCLSFGLAAILGFIGVNLILHAPHENTVPFIREQDQ